MGKSNYGQGSIELRANGSWRWRGTIGGRRRSVSAQTKRELLQKVRTLQSNADKGILPPTERLTLDQHIQRWLEVKRNVVKPRTYESYSYLTRAHILPSLGSRQLASLGVVDIQDLYGQLLGKGLSPQTVHHVHTCLNTVLAQAVKWNLVPRNVASLADAPKVPRKELLTLTSEQVEQLLAKSRGTRWGTLSLVAIATGLRQSELLGLRWSDIQWEAGTLYVQRQYGKDGAFAETKTGKGRRIDLSTKTLDVLRAHRSKQNEYRLSMGAEWENNDLVFCTHQGRPLGHRNVLREFKKLLQKAELPDVSFHALRHTAATLMFLNNVQPKVIQERLDHSTIQMTMDIYSHLVPSMGKDAAESIDQYLA